MVRKCENGFKAIYGLTGLEIGKICFKLDSVFTKNLEEIYPYVSNTHLYLLPQCSDMASSFQEIRLNQI